MSARRSPTRQRPHLYLVQARDSEEDSLPEPYVKKYPLWARVVGTLSFAVLAWVLIFAVATIFIPGL